MNKQINKDATIIRIGPEDSVSVHTHYGDHGERTYREILILSGHDKQESFPKNAENLCKGEEVTA